MPPTTTTSFSIILTLAYPCRSLLGIMNHELHDDQHRAEVAHTLHTLKEHTLQVGCTCFWCQPHTQCCWRQCLALCTRPFSLYTLYITVSSRESCNRDLLLVISHWFVAGGCKQDFVVIFLADLIQVNLRVKNMTANKYKATMKEEALAACRKHLKCVALWQKHF